MPVITNLTRNTVLADRAELADRALQRMLGLLGRGSLSAGEALVLPRCNAIHTWFMRFPIDVLFVRTALGSRLEARGLALGSRLKALGKSSGLQPTAYSLERSSLEPRASSLEQPQQGVVVKVVEHLKPFRLVWAPRADTVIEMPSGGISNSRTKEGELLEIA